ncbi:MAG: PAS domain-containing sensor histidine kinase [Planctomycetes bacterium]|nr:PAS domain-containing sensor histidine kinase [Planctomycetota bacterium]
MSTSPILCTDEIADLLDEGLLLINHDGEIVKQNKAAKKMLGIEVVVGTKFTAVITHLGEGCEAFGELTPGNSNVIVVDGALIEGKLSAVSEGSLLLLTDRSEELRWQSQLAEQGHMLSSNNEAYLVIDQRGMIRYANNFCEEERLYAFGELVGMHLQDVEIGRDIDGVSSKAYSQEEIEVKLKRCFDSGQVERYEAWHVRSDGEIFPTDVSIRPFRMSSETVLLLRARDETERYRQLQALMDARAEAESSNRAKSAFMAVTSHELRTPLTTVIGFLELLKLDYGEGFGDLSSYLDLMHKSSRSLLRLIEDILDFTKIEGRTLKLEIRSVDIESFTKQISESWTMKCDKKALEFHYKINGDISGCMTTDSVRLNQLFDNIINNAYKFTSHGAIELSVRKDADNYYFEIADSGCGIDESFADHIFEPFYQIDDVTTRSSEGTGLGLYICRNLSRLLGGDVQLLKSTEDGSVFELRMPINAEDGKLSAKLIG